MSCHSEAKLSSIWDIRFSCIFDIQYRNHMKKLFICLLFISLVYGCKKDPSPDAVCYIPFQHNSGYFTDSNSYRHTFYFFPNESSLFSIDSSSSVIFYVRYPVDTIVTAKFYNTRTPGNPSCFTDGSNIIWDYDILGSFSSAFILDSVRVYLDYSSRQSALNYFHCTSGQSGHDTITFKY